MKWVEERDLLIAQTMTFVQSVTGKNPDGEARIEFAPLDQIAKVARPVEIIQARPMPMPRSGFREEIEGRVAAFRAHQQLFIRERDAYCKAVLTKVRASIPSQPKPSSD
jgi:hypothetical protein